MSFYIMYKWAGTYQNCFSPVFTGRRYGQQDPAGAGGHYLVYRCLYRRSGAWRIAGYVQRPIRGRGIAGVEISPNHALDHIASGAQDRHSAVGQHPDFGVQGYIPGRYHSTFRFSENDQDGPQWPPMDGFFSGSLRFCSVDIFSQSTYRRSLKNLR